MPNWTNLKESIADSIYANDNQEITGLSLRSVLINIVDNIVGQSGKVFAGLIEPQLRLLNSPDQNVFFLAVKPGTYMLGFSQAIGVLKKGNIGIIYNNNNTGWTLTQVQLPINTENIENGSITNVKLSTDLLNSIANIRAVMSIKPSILSLGSTKPSEQNAGKFLNIYHPIFKISNDSDLIESSLLKDIKICLMVYQRRVGKRYFDKVEQKNKRRNYKRGWCVSCKKDIIDNNISPENLAIGEQKIWPAFDGGNAEEIIQINEDDIKTHILQEYITVNSKSRTSMHMYTLNDLSIEPHTTKILFGSETASTKVKMNMLFGIAVRCDNPSFTEDLNSYPYRNSRIDRYIYSNVFKIRVFITKKGSSGYNIGLSCIG